MERLGDKKEYEKEKVKNISQKRHKELLKHLKENETNFDMFRMCGGEPLLSDRMWEMCDQVSDEYAKEMKLFITTNLTELEYKGNSVHKLAEKFKHLC